MEQPDGQGPGSSHVDAAGTSQDAPSQVWLDAPGQAAAPGALLISEVTIAQAGHEFIEIVNPSTQAVDLSSYYLSDNGNYFKLPAGVPTVAAADFIVKFPAGAQIPGHGVVTVATDTAASFTTSYGVAPTYSIADATVDVIVKSGVPTLTDAGELVVLFQWNGTDMLVKDVDMVLVGVPTAANGLVSKSGYVQGGSTYATDADTLAPQAAAPWNGKSTKRLMLDSSYEVAGGNGLMGQDETSELTSTTWDSTYGAPTPGQVPTALLQ
jgi:hypothetical protein